ncbi:SAF domain-containing protein [Amycolatopsis anabasis]|uniref:SAF domain-containing protein n=1 Tax=Amycolatopsis anabasis TaxID=1840409 RepID=UPI00131EA5C9|nr:SAF domain-containing protein [Amycolatopsis anabasis]
MGTNTPRQPDGARPARPWWERLRPRVRGRPLSLFRKGLAVVLLLAAAILAFLPAAGGDSGTATVVSARDLPPGSTLGDTDVRTVSMPGPLRPQGAFTSPDAVRGHLLAGAARAGEPITDLRLVRSPPALPGTGESGSATVPVRLADADVAELLHPGTRVDVVALDAGEQGRKVLASGATVITVVAEASGRAGERRATGTEAKGPLVLVAVPADHATQVAAASLGRPVTVTLR